MNDKEGHALRLNHSGMKHVDNEYRVMDHALMTITSHG